VTAAVALPFRVGARTLWRVRLRLARVAVGLEQARGGEVPRLPALGTESDGYLITSLPEERLPDVWAAHPELKPFVRQRYRRNFAALEGSFDDYLAGFSAKSRSTLKRKVRRFGETLDVRAWPASGDVGEFHRLARAVSAKTYQEKLLGAGLPDGAEALARMRELAARDAMRGWILFLEGRPVSYLYAPAEGGTLIYSHLGYDPDFADLSPGTVLQYEAMRQLFAEGRFGLFDFTEGEGQHKRQFGTGAVDCVDLLLVRPSLRTLAAAYALDRFDAFVAAAKRAVRGGPLEKLAGKLRR
jgi:CelD/BcsL family acetyltransferase involved in cellulose biosynthesis